MMKAYMWWGTALLALILGWRVDAWLYRRRRRIEDEYQARMAEAMRKACTRGDE